MDFKKKWQSLVLVSGFLAASAFGIWFLAWQTGPLKSIGIFTEEAHSIYHMSMSTKSSLDLSKLKAAGQQGIIFPSLADTQMAIEGDLHVKRSGQIVFLALLNSKATVQGQLVNVSELIDPYFTMILDNQALPKSFQTSSNVKSSHYAFWMQLVGQLQVSLNDSRQSQWIATEKDYQSSFSAEYALSNRELVKTKSQVEVSNRFAQLDSVVYQFEGEPKLRIAIERDKQRHVESHETIVARSGSEVFYKNLIQLRMVEQLPLSESAKDVAKFPSIESNKFLSLGPGALEALAAHDTEESAFRNDLQGATLEQILADLEKNLGHEEEIEFYKRLRAFLYLYPKETEKFHEQLTQAAMDGMRMRTIAVALGRVGHSEAQQLLRAVIEERSSNSDPMDNLLMLLVQTEQPTPETINYVASLQRMPESSLYDTAQLAYGQMLSQLQKSDPAQANLLLTKLLNSAGKAGTKSIPMLSLIGNSGMSEGLDFVFEQLKSTDISIQVKALDALRLIADPRAKAKLVSFIHSDKPPLKVAALDALQWQSFDQNTWTLVKDLLFDAKQASEIKKSCLDYAKNHQNDIQGIRELLQDFLNTEKDIDLKRQARSIVDLK